MNSEKQSTNLQMILREVNRVGEGQKNVPKLRFKGYEDAWEQRKLGTAIDVKSGKDYKQLDEGDVPVYGTGGYMLSVSEALENTRDAIGIGRKGTIDKPFVLKAPFWTVDTLFYGIPKENNSLSFLYSLFQSINWKLYDESTGVPSLSKTAIDGVTIKLTSEDEQSSIGECFESVDNLITLHQRKYDALKSMKKTLLSKMFPKNGEDVPEIRFKGFTDAWEQRKLGEVLDFSLKTNSLSRSMLNYEEGELKNIHYGDILMDYGPILNFKTDTIPYITEGKVEEFTSQLLMNGDVVFADAAEDESVGKAIEINGLEEQCLVSGLHTIVGRPTIKFAERFLGYYINSNSYHNQLLPLMQGTKVSSISKTTLQKTMIIYPKVNSEQLKIGSFFYCLESIITLHQRKLEELKNMKKTLLQQMFV